MIYALKVFEYGEPRWVSVDEAELNLNRSPGHLKFYSLDKQCFEACLREFLHEHEGTWWLPKEDEPWEFHSGSSLENIQKGEGTLLATMHTGNQGSLWTLFEWCSGIVTGFKVVESC